MYWVEDDYFIGRYSCFWGDTICNDYFMETAALRGSVQNTAAGETFNF